MSVLFHFFTSVSTYRGEIKANKVLLSLVSEVFLAQFFGELPEKSEEGYP